MPSLSRAHGSRRHPHAENPADELDGRRSARVWEIPSSRRSEDGPGRIDEANDFRVFDDRHRNRRD